MVTWTKLPALEKPGFRSGCLTCGPQPVNLDLGAILMVGFGECSVTKDGECVYSENQLKRGQDGPPLRKFEKVAADDPDHDYQVHFYGPMSETHYQRHGDGQWVLVKRGEGFA